MTDQPVPPQWPDNALHIESMDLDAQGVAHRTDGKVVFVDGALPFEVVRANVHRKKKTTGSKPRCWRCCKNPRNVCAPIAPTLDYMLAHVVVAKCNTSNPVRKWPSNSVRWKTTCGT